MANFCFADQRTLSVLRWIDGLVIQPILGNSISPSHLNTITDMDDDPWDWAVDRVVQELCTENRSWQPYANDMRRPDPAPLETALREQEIHGYTLLQDIEDQEIKEVLGIKVFGHRSFIKCAIIELRHKSLKYLEYHKTHTIRSASSHHTLSINNFVPEHAPAANLSTPAPQYPISPGLSATNDTPIDRRSPNGEYTVDTPGNKRRRLDSEDPAGNDLPEFADDTNQDVGTIGEAKSPEVVNEESAPSPLPDLEQPTNVKIKKRIAPTLITSTIDPDRNRVIPTLADDLSDSKIIEVGVPYLGKDGKKRLLPTLQSTPSSLEPYAYAATPIAPNLAAPSTNDSRPKSKEVSKSIDDVLATGYLGKRKMRVDNVFYEEIEAGQELPDSNDDMTISLGMKDISSGRRLYVNRLMRHFLRSKPQSFVRDGKLHSAIIPYDPKLTPRFQNPSFTLFSESPEGRIQPRREELRSWPEINPEATPQNHDVVQGENSATFNLGISDLLNGLGSYDDWDPDNLEKYNDLEGGDEILPLYGDSDSDNDYDEETWREIEAEQGEKLEKTERPSRRPPIGEEEVNAAIDVGIARLAAKWRETKLPKLQPKGFRLWNKAHKLKTWKADILTAQNKFDHLVARIEKIRDEIVSEIWTSEKQVMKQVSIFEPSVFDRENLAWKIAVLKMKTPPAKPSQSPQVKIQKSTVPKVEGQGEGEGDSLDSDSSSDDEMDDFIIDDDPMDLEEHELDLADGEGSDDDATISDASESGSLAKPVTPSKNSTPFQSDSPATSTASTPQSNQEDTPSSRATVKDEEPSLPQHRPEHRRSVSENVIDLTMLTSDSAPEISPKPTSNFVDLTVTPKKKKSKITVTHRNSGSRSPITLDSDSFPDPDKLPSLKNMAEIGKYGFEIWEQLLDRERLLICIIYRMEPETRERILDFVSSIKEAELWYSMAQVMTSYRDSQRDVKGMDASLFKTLNMLIRLFEGYVDRKYYPYSEIPAASSIQKVAECQKVHFTNFFKFIKKLQGYFDRKPASQPSSSPSARKGKAVASEESDEDGEPLSAVRQKRSEALT